MRKYLLLLLFLIALLSVLHQVFKAKVGIFKSKNINPSGSTNSTTARKPEENINSSQIFSVTSSPKEDFGSFEVDDYKVLWITLRNPAKLSLFTNLQEKLTSLEASRRYGCSSLVSGSFFSNTGHIGLFITEGRVLANSFPHLTFNGYFVVGDYFLITKTPPTSKDIRLAVQAGPILVWDGNPQNLILSRDENARRIVVATTLDKKEVVFLALLSKKNYLLGPKLSELAGILSKIKTKIALDKALNLDGGTHSAFISNSESVFEIATAGSFFCINP